MKTADSKRSAMRLTLGSLFLLTVLSIFASAAHAGMCGVPAEADLWENRNPNTRSITQLNFRMECRDATTTTCSNGICRTTYGVEAHYFIHLWGSCSPTDCDWGEREGVRMTGSLDGWYYFHYDHGFAKRHVYARSYPAWPGWLRLYIWTDFVDPGRADYASDEWFVPR